MQKALRWLRNLQAMIVLLMIVPVVPLYMLVAGALAALPYNRKYKAKKSGIEIYINSNGVHTDITLPIRSSVIDWNEIFPFEDFPRVNSAFKYLSFGWGDKGFYIETRKWADLAPYTAFQALFGLNETAMHVVYLRHKPRMRRNSKRVFIDEEQYKIIIQHILEYVTPGQNGKPILIKDGRYTKRDNFYEAEGHYSLFLTCNAWTNAALKKAGVRSAYWAPFDWGIFYQLNKTE